MLLTMKVPVWSGMSSTGTGPKGQTMIVVALHPGTVAEISAVVATEVGIPEMRQEIMDGTTAVGVIMDVMLIEDHLLTTGEEDTMIGEMTGEVDMEIVIEMPVTGITLPRVIAATAETLPLGSLSTGMTGVTVTWIGVMVEHGILPQGAPLPEKVTITTDTGPAVVVVALDGTMGVLGMQVIEMLLPILEVPEIHPHEILTGETTTPLLPVVEVVVEGTMIVTARIPTLEGAVTGATLIRMVLVLLQVVIGVVIMVPEIRHGAGIRIYQTRTLYLV